MAPLLSRRGVPKIGGTVGGFVAVIVCLILVILVSVTAIYVLLRRSDSHRDRASRSRRRYQHTALPSSTSFEYRQSSVSSPNFFTKLRNLFSSVGSGGSITGSTRSSRLRGPQTEGWQQAGSGDEWDAEEDLNNHSPPPRSRQPMQSSGVTPSISSSRHVSGDASAFPQTSANMQSFSSLSYVAHEPPSLSSLALHAPGAETPPVRTDSPNEMEATSASPDTPNSRKVRHFSVESGVATFEGGTKFVEGL